MKLAELKNKRILILGFAREGMDNFRFLRKIFPDKILGVGDRQEKIKNQKPSVNLWKRGGRRERSSLRPSKIKNVKWHLGENYLRALKNYDVIIKSPGIPPKTIKPFLKKGQIVTSQTEIFFENCPGKIIGVAGTKGKSTTASLIYKILKESEPQRGLKKRTYPLRQSEPQRGLKKRTYPLRQGGYRVHLVGNIGKPVLSLLFPATPKDIYVYEISSHQLMNLKKGPAVAILLNIYPDHLDYYKNFKEYAKSEQKIAHYLTKNDYLIFNPADKLVLAAAKISKAKKIPINPEIVEKFIKIKDIPLEGKFHFLNMAAAIEVGKIFEIPAEKIKKAIKEFKSLPHRLELAGEYRGIKFYNASLAVIPETTIAIMEGLGKKVQTIFLGGFDRDLNYQELAKKILNPPAGGKIKTIILFPTSGEKIWQEIEKEARKNKVKNLPRHFFVDRAKKTSSSSSPSLRLGRAKSTSSSSSPSPRYGAAQYMKEGVRIAYQFTEKGKICLLAPASASFGLFKDYRERGNLFKKQVFAQAKTKMKMK